MSVTRTIILVDQRRPMSPSTQNTNTLLLCSESSMGVLIHGRFICSLVQLDKNEKRLIFQQTKINHLEVTIPSLSSVGLSFYVDKIEKDPRFSCSMQLLVLFDASGCRC